MEEINTTLVGLQIFLIFFFFFHFVYIWGLNAWLLHFIFYLTIIKARQLEGLIFITSPSSFGNGWLWIVLLMKCKWVFLAFQIFKGWKIAWWKTTNDYVKNCKLGMYMVMQKKHGETLFLLHKYLFLKRVLFQSGIFQSNHSLLILDEHGSHVTK